jgi:ribosomal protein S27E
MKRSRKDNIVSTCRDPGPNSKGADCAKKSCLSVVILVSHPAIKDNCNQCTRTLVISHRTFTSGGEFWMTVLKGLSMGQMVAMDQMVVANTVALFLQAETRV